MEKMTGVYLQNPSLGDPASMEEELKGNAKELDKYSQELFKYQSYLAIIEKTPAPTPPPCYSKPSHVQPPPAPSENVPPPAPSILVPPVEEPEDDNEFDDEERCRVLYDFEGRKIINQTDKDFVFFSNLAQLQLTACYVVVYGGG